MEELCFIEPFPIFFYGYGVYSVNTEFLKIN